MERTSAFSGKLLSIGQRTWGFTQSATIWRIPRDGQNVHPPAHLSESTPSAHPASGHLQEDGVTIESLS